MTGRILVVDDVERNVKLLETKLSNEYYTILTAYSGQEALEIAHNEEPDIILLDIMMPIMDGYETCRRLKSDSATSHIPVIMVTALSDKNDKIEGLCAGASDFITKPVDELHLFARVRSLIRVKQMFDELIARNLTYSKFNIQQQKIFDINHKLTGNILIIDDDIIEKRNIAKHLLNNGHKIENGAADIDYLPASNSDILIINSVLDNVDGIRLAMKIRSLKNYKNMPIIIMIDEDDKDILIKAINLGIDDYLITPIDLNELEARVMAQLRYKKYKDMLQDSYKQKISQAIYDPLTSLYNRRYIEEHFGNILQIAKEKNSYVSCLIIDIDEFKYINDKQDWGHAIGDEVLQYISETIKNSFRPTEIASRIGGDEFMVILPNTNYSGAIIAAKRLHSKIAESDIKISKSPHIARTTISIGIASLSLDHKDEETIKTISERADKALYIAKREGRNQVKYIDINDL